MPARLFRHFNVTRRFFVPAAAPDSVAPLPMRCDLGTARHDERMPARAELDGWLPIHVNH